MASLPTQSPSLLSRIEYGRDSITGVFAILGEDAVICTSDDKTVKVWVKRDNGQYWPSIVQNFDSSCSALEYEPESDSDGHKVFVGMGNGQVHEYRLSKDLNRFERKRTHNSHSSRVTSLKLVSKHNWILSTGRDKRFQWSCTRTGRSLGSHESTAWCLAVEYDDTNKYAFIADYSGIINVFKLEEANFSLVTTLKGHTSSIWALSYDQERRILFSGGFDEVIVVWDIGTQQGTAYELTGHSGKIRALAYSSHTRKLLSTSEDGKLGVWDMDAEREETVEWAVSNICEKCSVPFFWNFRGMWEGKVVGVRQHHCRKCGRAICSSCSNQLSTYPKMGFEKPVRMCQDCHTSLTTDDRCPMASFISIKSTITKIHLVQTRGLMVTASEDKQIKIWDATPLMMNH